MANSWKDEAVKKAMLMGISDGTRPDEPCTRAECMAMAERAVDAAVTLFIEVLKEAVENKV